MMKNNSSLAWLTAAALLAGSMSAMVTSPESAQAQSFKFDMMGGFDDDAFAQSGTEPSISINAHVNEIYAEMPFVLSVTVKNLDQDPQPELDDFQIFDPQGNPETSIRLLGVTPQVSSMTTVINGKVTRRKNVTHVYQFEITPQHEGTYTIPQITVRQGNKSATTASKLSFTAKSIQTTQDMRLELKFPEREYWVGETIDATIEWYLRKDVGEHNFNIPLFKMPEYFDIQEPEDTRGRIAQSIVMSIGSHQAAFQYSQDNAMVDGIQYSRISIPVRFTPLKSGVINIPGARVQAELAVSVQDDIWGFGRKNYQRFRAEDKDRTCIIKPLPTAGKPATFSNAMGSEFTIETSVDRTIVKAGDPVILTIDISSADSMNGLILPSLESAGLNEQLFGISTEDPIGENIDGGPRRNITRFSVPVRIKSDRVTEIPPIAFSYFNPKTGEYSTVRSQPIALSVSAVTKVGAADVFAPQKGEAPTPANPADPDNQAQTQQNLQTTGLLELSLQSNQDTLANAHSQVSSLPIRIALYAFPFPLWGLLILLRRNRKSREASAPQKQACLALKEAIDKANSTAPQDAATQISNALNTVLTATDTPRAPFNEVCEQMEIAAYTPDAQRLPESVTKNLIDCLKKNINPAFAKLIASIFALLLVCAAFIQPANAQTSDTDTLNQAMESYHSAMNITDRSERAATFKRAYAQFNKLGDAYPDIAEIQVDAGNAAFNAADFGHAVLAYKRALEIDPSNAQAQTNLAHIQAIQGDISKDQSHITSLLPNVISRDTQLLIAAILFAIGMLLIIPWKPSHKRVTRAVAVIPLLAWLFLLISAYATPEKDEAVVQNECSLKTADNAGATNVSNGTLLPGYTVTIVKSNGDWAQVKNADNTQGWLPLSAIERVKRN